MVRQLDLTHKYMQQEVTDLDFINSRIEADELSNFNPILRQLMQVHAEVNLLRAQLQKSATQLTTHYEFQAEADSFILSDELVETKQTVVDEGPVVQIIKGITTFNQRNEYPSWSQKSEHGAATHEATGSTTAPKGKLLLRTKTPNK